MKLETAKKRLKGFGKVTNMVSAKSNRAVPNQTVIEFDNGTVFKSYDSIIAIKLNDKVYLGKNWNYSKTTNLYRGQFLNEGVAETRQKIQDGTYKIMD